MSSIGASGDLSVASSIPVVASPMAYVSTWCHPVPVSPGFFGKNSVRQQKMSEPMIACIRRTISGSVMSLLRPGMSR